MKEPDINFDSEKPVLRGGEISDFIARITTKTFIALSMVFIFAAVQLIRHGTTSDYILLLVGSILSAVAIVAYALQVFVEKNRRSVLLMIITLSGFIPYIFGAYLVFYRGFWRMKCLFAEFSIIILLEAVLFVLIGYV